MEFNTLISTQSYPNTYTLIQRQILKTLFGFLIFISVTVNCLYAQTNQQIKIPEKVLESYNGKYALSPSFILTFTNSGDTLKVSPNGQPVGNFIAVSQTKFVAEDNDEVSIEFVNGNEKVILTQDGQKQEASRLELNIKYDPLQTYSIAELKDDFTFFRMKLENDHPRLYEFTPKETFNNLFDSLYNAINHPMNELEFRYLLLPALAMVHCGHTSLSPSIQFSQIPPQSIQPFILYFENGKAFIRNSLSSDLKPGQEVVAINGVSIKTRINNYMNRVSGDGIHNSVQYYIMNRPGSWLSYETPYWFNVSNYDVSILNSDKSINVINVKGGSSTDLYKLMPPPLRKNEFILSADEQTGILTYPNMNYPNDIIRDEFLNNVFDELKNKNISNLIIDLRGNGGGSPTNSAFLLKYLMKKDFIYSNVKDIPEYEPLTKPTIVTKNRFNGKLFFLIDGGCGSSTGHLLSIVKYYELGTLIGELSSATYTSNTSGLTSVLQNSKLILKCPDGTYDVAVKGFDHSKGIPPDIEVNTTLQDVLKGRDPAMEFTLNHITELRLGNKIVYSEINNLINIR